MVDSPDAPGIMSFKRSLHGHPADGSVAHLSTGGGAHMTLINPWADNHLEWVARYGNVEAVRYSIAGVLASYGYLLSDRITTAEAIRRLRMLRKATASLRGREPGQVGSLPYSIEQSTSGSGAAK